MRFDAMRHSATVLLATIVLGFLSPVRTAAHPGHDHKLMGVISAIDGRHVTMKTTDGKELTFEITSTTRLLRAKKPGALADLTSGMRIVCNVGDGEEPLRAKELEYVPARSSKRD